MSGMKSRFALAAISAVAAFGAVAALILSGNPSAVPQSGPSGGSTVTVDAAVLATALKACVNLPEQEIGICQTKVTDDAGFDPMTAVSRIAATVSTPSQCHSAAHDLGKRLWKLASTLVPDGMPYDTCNYGVVHGAIAAAALEVGADELLELIERACPAEDGACWHGAGHAFTEVVDTPAQAMELCRSISQARVCIGGAAMEYTLQRDGTGYEICSSLESGEQLECEIQVAYALGGRMQLSEDYVRGCAELGRDGCVIGSGWAVYTYGPKDLNDAGLICDQFGARDVICYANALSMKVNAEGTTDDAVGVCASVFGSRRCDSIITEMANNRG